MSKRGRDLPRFTKEMARVPHQDEWVTLGGAVFLVAAVETNIDTGDVFVEAKWEAG